MYGVSCCFFIPSRTFFLDSGSFSNALAQVENPCPTYLTTAIYVNLVDEGAVQRENSLNAYTVRNFAHGKGFSNSGIAALDNVALEQLDTLFISFFNLVVNSYSVTGFEFRYFLTQVFGTDGFYYRIHRSGEWGCKCRNSFHNIKAFIADERCMFPVYYFCDMSYRWRNAAYLFSFTPAILVVYGNMTGGWTSWLNLCYSLFFLGILEQLSGSSSANEHSPASDPFPEFILFAHVLTHSIGLGSLFHGIHSGILEGSSLLGAILSTGTAAGSSGIIVAHELIHKADNLKRLLGNYLLTSTGNFYFYVHHLRIHHRHVATSQDAATAREGENLYAFFVRSVREQISQSAASEQRRLGEQWFSGSNDFLKSVAWVLLFGIMIYAVAGIYSFLSWLGVCFFANFLLEYVNYIEHYGLTRNPETKVNEWHSWSCNKHISRFLLIDLSRHADHHNKASKPYHTLEAYSQGPILPGGYASLIIPALLPFWWFHLTHPMLRKIRKQELVRL